VPGLWSDRGQTIGVHLALFADDTCQYATDRKVGYIVRKLQRGLNSMVAWYESWNIKINEDRTRAIYFSHQRAPHESLILNGRNIPFVKNVKYLGVIFDKRITWRLHTKRIEAKAFRTFIRLYSIFKSERLNANIKLTLLKALIRSVMTYACPACKTGFCAPSEIFQGAHRSVICMWLSKFLTYMTI
jgi:hypothetical protein